MVPATGRLEPELEVGAVEALDVVRHLGAQRPGLQIALRVQDQDLAVRAGVREGAQDGRGRRAADAGGGQDNGAVAFLEGDLAVGVGDLEDVAHLDAVVQDGGDFAAVVLLGGEGAAGAGVAGQRVLADLAQSVREGDLDADVLAREGGGDGGVVGRFQGEGHGAGAGGGLGGDPPRAPHRAVGLRGVEALFELDQCVGHEPVDLGPGFGDFRGDDLGQVFGDGGEQVLVDHLVLRFGDAKGGVAVGDAGEHRLRQGAGVVHQVGGESGDASGQGLLLVAVALVGAAEEPVQQFRVRGEEAGVELGGDLTDPGSDQREGGLDDGEGLVREHSDS